MKAFVLFSLICLLSCDKVNTKPLTNSINKKLNGKWEVINFTPVYSDFDLSVIPNKVIIDFKTLNKEISADIIVDGTSFVGIELGNTFHGSKEFAGINFKFPGNKTDFKKYLFSVEPYSAVFYPNEDVVLEGASHSIRLRKIL
ncbi:hypothetical protein EGI22_01850 [Lacihabitans sp. LS3-19]|uniref:hypothetical protein n=1 Tax=Lacihabitans sp. LS3-19 TaxID=2487335 RepID=UPI0020CE12D7|nr:hypothetical protein [Lacihabitans sp. LS3-19]MCP9766633.1 hypothetical protein [Lacihabitans sp. LS3-19]